MKTEIGLEQLLDKLDYYESNYEYLTPDERWEYAELEFNLSIEYNRSEEDGA